MASVSGSQPAARSRSFPHSVSARKMRALPSLRSQINPLWPLVTHSQRILIWVTRSACKPCGKLSLHFFVWDTLATIKLIHPFLDCCKKFDLLGDFLQRNFIRQLANCVQDNFLLAHRE